MNVCPFCHDGNACAVASDQACWCFNESIPTGLLDLLEGDDLNKKCVCQNCIAEYKKSPAKFEVKLRHNRNVSD
ncbi:cysteine-rich CWC family protein [Marinomonas primoryensis]|jgi:hypothetical protein|uniref:cysteine-rich CWC family protein n=1 Tax=Marinomonas primoryensis TaxID=178399 RepID=UPI0032AFC550|tara:strand:- start:367 stop:588 length:222 start_codon:yes stop_codon:yes gene_type:complete